MFPLRKFQVHGDREITLKLDVDPQRDDDASRCRHIGAC